MRKDVEGVDDVGRLNRIDSLKSLRTESRV